MYKSVILMVMAIFMITICYGFPSGAPKSACETMTPCHNDTLPQAGPAPFEVVAEALTERAPLQVSVTLRSTSDSLFKGFLVKAVDSQNITTGEFVVYPQASSQPLDCNVFQDAMTHIDNDDKDEEVFVWQATDTGIDVFFRATFVVEYETFYVDVRSEIISV